MGCFTPSGNIMSNSNLHAVFIA